MKTLVTKISIIAAFLLLANIPAWAIIDKIEWFAGGEFRPNDVIKLPQSCLGSGSAGSGSSCMLTVYGGGTDLATEIAVSGSDITTEIIKRTPGIGSSITFLLRISNDAATTERTVTLKYPLGQDAFKIKVVRRGAIRQIEAFRPPPQLGNTAVANPTLNRPGGNFGNRTVSGEPTQPLSVRNLAINTKIKLVVTGTKLNNVGIKPDSGYTARILPGATETRCEIEITFSETGVYNIKLFDETDLNAATGNLNRFFYKEASSGSSVVSVFINSDVRADAGSGNTGGGNIGGGNIIGIGGSTGGQSAPFIDVAPRANMSNVFRRLSNFAPFELNGLTLVRVEDRWCAGMNGSDENVITVPDLIWGVTNSGTQNVAQNFSAVLKSNGTTLDTETISNLFQGATQNFTFRRQRSTVRVRTRADRQGCFISPDDPDNYFEDPAFTVEVDAANALGEDQDKRANNSRNY